MDILIKLISLMIFLHAASSAIAEEVCERKEGCYNGDSLMFKNDKIKKLLDRADTYIEKSQFIEAIDTLNEGIELVGDEHLSSSTIDDTGQKLMLAHIEVRNGRYNVAANLLRNVLSSRLNILQSRR